MNNKKGKEYEEFILAHVNKTLEIYFVNYKLMKL